MKRGLVTYFRHSLETSCKIRTSMNCGFKRTVLPSNIQSTIEFSKFLITIFLGRFSSLKRVTFFYGDILNRVSMLIVKNKWVARKSRHY